MILLQGKQHDLGGGMVVRRLIPQIAKRMIGPFVFLDHMGPVQIKAGQNTDVRPHPHIGLSTLTYLFEGRMVHRDSVGSTAEIKPGDVNWMTAGSGISHSERAHESDRERTHKLHGLQCWIALPDDLEDCEPSFQHYNAKVIPRDINDDRELSLIAGQGFKMHSPVVTSSPMLFAEIKSKRDCTLKLNEFHFELGVYVISGAATVGDKVIKSHDMMILEPGETPLLAIQEGSHVVVLGGEPLQTPRHVWWNLVSTSREKIEAAKLKWKNGNFPMVPGETEFIPLPEN